MSEINTEDLMYIAEWRIELYGAVKFGDDRGDYIFDKNIDGEDDPYEVIEQLFVEYPEAEIAEIRPCPPVDEQGICLGDKKAWDNEFYLNYCDIVHREPPLSH